MQQNLAFQMHFSNAGRGDVRCDPWIALQHRRKSLIAEAKCLTGWVIYSTGHPVFSTGLYLTLRRYISLYLFLFKREEEKRAGENVSTGCKCFSTGFVGARIVIHGLAAKKRLTRGIRVINFQGES